MLKKCFIFLSLIYVTSNVFGADLQTKISTDYKNGNISYQQYLAYRGYSIFAPQKIRDIYGGYETEQAIKSGTGIVLELKENWNVLSDDDRNFFSQFINARPTLDSSFVSTSGYFKVHYNLEGFHQVPSADEDNNGIPDYVERVAEALDKARALYVDTLGFLPPFPDGGKDGNEFDVYLRNLQTTYGMTYTSDVYMDMENDYSETVFYTKGIEGAFVTAAHELHHAVQFSYIIRSQDFYIYEATSTYMEDAVFDNINDYYQYLTNILGSNVLKPFTTRDYWHEYGLAIWWHFLTKKYDRTITREFWDVFKNNMSSLNALDIVLTNHGSSFNESLNEFHRWNYFTGTRANPEQYYKEGASYPEITKINNILVTDDTTQSLSSTYLTPSYVLFSGLTPREYEITVTTTDDSNIDSWENSLLFFGQTDESILYSFNSIDSNSENTSFKNQGINSEALVVLTTTERTANTSPSSGGNYSVNISLTAEEIPELEKNALKEIYPNPYILNEHSFINIAFSLEKTSDVKIVIISSSGKVIKVIEKQNMSAGLHQYDVTWDGTDEDNVTVSSGIYLCQLRVGKYSEMKKIAVIRK